MKVITLKKHHQYKKSTPQLNNKHISNQPVNWRDHHPLSTNQQEPQPHELPLVD